MRLIVEGFTQGLVDEEEISRMGLINYKPGPGQEDVSVTDCPASHIEGFDFSPHRTLSKIPGREWLHSSPWVNSAIIRTYAWSDANAVDYALVFSCVSGTASASIASMTASAGNTLFTTITAPSGSVLADWAPELMDAIDIVAFAGSAVMTYGSGLPLAAYTGSLSVLPLTGTNSPIGAKVVAAWGSYLFAGNIIVGGQRQRSRVVWCDPLNVENWPAAQYMDFDTEDGDPITAMWLFKDVLVVFKVSKTYIVKYVGGALVFAWERIDNSVGCVGPNAIAEVDGILYFIGQDGFFAYDGSRPPYPISDMIQHRVGRMDLTKAYIFEVETFSDRDYVLFSVVDGSSDYKNKIYIYQPSTKGWTQMSMLVSSMGHILYGSHQIVMDYPESYTAYGGTIGDAGLANDTFFAMGSYGGHVHRFGDTINDLGDAISARWVSPWIDFGFPDRNKRILRASIFMDSTGDSNYPIIFNAYSDWNDTVPTVTKTISSAGMFKDIVERRIDFTLPVRSFKFELISNQLNASTTIHKVVFEFRIKGRTLTS